MPSFKEVIPPAQGEEAKVTGKRSFLMSSIRHTSMIPEEC
jgi:hypothetical protein